MSVDFYISHINNIIKSNDSNENKFQQIHKFIEMADKRNNNKNTYYDNKADENEHNELVFTHNKDEILISDMNTSGKSEKVRNDEKADDDNEKLDNDNKKTGDDNESKFTSNKDEIYNKRENSKRNKNIDDKKIKLSKNRKFPNGKITFVKIQKDFSVKILKTCEKMIKTTPDTKYVINISDVSFDWINLIKYSGKLLQLHNLVNILALRCHLNDEYLAAKFIQNNKYYRKLIWIDPTHLSNNKWISLFNKEIDWYEYKDIHLNFMNKYPDICFQNINNNLNVKLVTYESLVQLLL